MTDNEEIKVLEELEEKGRILREYKGKFRQICQENKMIKGSTVLELYDKIPSLTVNERQNSRKACIYRLCGCFFVCIDMYYIFVFVLVILFVFEIIPRMEAFDINSKSVLNPNEL